MDGLVVIINPAYSGSSVLWSGGTAVSGTALRGDELMSPRRRGPTASICGYGYGYGRNSRLKVLKQQRHEPELCFPPGEEVSRHHRSIKYGRCLHQDFNRTRLYVLSRVLTTSPCEQEPLSSTYFIRSNKLPLFSSSLSML